MKFEPQMELDVSTAFPLFDTHTCFVCKHVFWFEKFWQWRDYSKYGWTKADGICCHCAPTKISAHIIISTYVPPPPPQRVNK